MVTRSLYLYEKISADSKCFGILYFAHFAGSISALEPLKAQNIVRFYYPMSVSQLESFSCEPMKWKQRYVIIYMHFPTKQQ